MRIFLDDIRTPPLIDHIDNSRLHWDHHCKTAEELISLIDTGTVTFISFDHDLGTQLTGYDVARYIEQLAAENKIPPINYYVHSANPVGAGNIDKAMKRAHTFWSQWKNSDNNRT